MSRAAHILATFDVYLLLFINVSWQLNTSIVRPVSVSTNGTVPNNPPYTYVLDESGANTINMIPVNGSSSIGCIVVNGSSSGTMSVLPSGNTMLQSVVVLPAEKYTKPGQEYTIDNCVKKCAELSTYTYAALEAGGDARCFCFNDLMKVTAWPCSGCLYASHGTVATFKNCKVDTWLRMFLAGTCPQFYFTPPLCLDRAKDTCRIFSTFPATHYNGICQTCSLNSSGLYSTISDYCDVLEDGGEVIEDYRISDIVLNNMNQAKYQVWVDDFDVNASVIASANSQQQALIQQAKYGGSKLQSYLDETTWSNGITISHKENVYGTGREFLKAHTTQRIYILHFWFRALAAGAFFFSMWEDDPTQQSNWANGIANKLQVLSNSNFNPSWMVAGYSSRLQTGMFKNFTLRYKHFIDVNRDGVSKLENVFLPLAVQPSRSNLKFGYHTLDSKKQWGGTGTLKENWQFSSLVCTTQITPMAVNVFNPDIVNYKNLWKRDTYPNGWVSGETATFSMTSEQWYVFNTPDYVDSSGYSWTLRGAGLDLSGFQGLRWTVNHYDNCNFKLMLAAACPDNCVRQKCNNRGECTYGCNSGYYGSKCSVTCPPAKYGPNCATDCSSNCVFQMCSAVTGICIAGCSSNMGALCNVPCDPGFYGGGCTSPCSPNCAAKNSCGANTGYCLGGCQVGYQPPLCELPCSTGMYGPNCTLQCGHCKNETCDVVSGNCKGGCDSNYMAPDCKCLRGTWGPNCANTCGSCKGGFACNAATGMCDGVTLPGSSSPIDPINMCEALAQPPMCVCKNGTWGTGCDNACGNCQVGLCMSDSGTCLKGCKPGFTGRLCDSGCIAGTWGMNCSNTCGSCATACDVFNGNCTNCVTGFKPPMCVECAPGYWGTNCQKLCGHCRNLEPCYTNGTCPFVPMPPTTDSTIFTGINNIEDAIAAANKATDSTDVTTIVNAVRALCEPGYEPLTCICKRGYYGGNCDKPCLNCLAGCTENGTCIGGCIAGFYGPTCSTPCPDGFFGRNCRLLCGHCFNKSGCTAEDGICKQGCDPGYMLPKCICPLGYFGDDCKRKCGQCAVGTTCSFLDATCQSGCQPGFKPPYCNCSVGTYRLDCLGKCGRCLGGKECDYINGSCPSGCDQNLNPPMCVQSCQPGRFGSGCGNVCGKCKSCEICQPDTGRCLSGCEPGFLAPLCIMMCPRGYFGLNCTQKCGYCYNNDTCDFVDGMCDRGCETGYRSPDCVAPCPKTHWGFNCLNPCGLCKNGSTCDYLDGRCPTGCLYSYLQEPFCVLKLDSISFVSTNLCSAGFYLPPLCATPCGHCLGGQPCESVYGYCLGGCEPGYEPLLCTKPCADGKYGSNCMEICGNCSGTANVTACRKTDGVCPNGCAPNWFSDRCKYKSVNEAVQAAKSASAMVDTTPLWYIIVVSCLQLWFLVRSLVKTT